MTAAPLPNAARADAPDIAIQIRGVSKVFRRRFGAGVKALDGVTLDIRRGEAFGLIGPNGAGKTTLLSCLLGFLRPTSGEILVEGLGPDDLAVRRVSGYMPERLGFDRFQTGRAFLESHFRLSGGAPAEAPEAALAGADAAGLERGALSRRLKTYSRGMLQRVGMAQALLREPRLLFLDEPASGIDPVGVRAIRQRILEAKGRGATIVLNSHQLPEIEKLCDRVAYIDRGRIVRVETLQGAESTRKARIRVRPGEEARAAEILAGMGLSPEAAGEGLLRIASADSEQLAEAARRICGGGLSLYELVSDADLESLFAQAQT